MSSEPLAIFGGCDMIQAGKAWYKDGKQFNKTRSTYTIEKVQ